MNYESIYRGVKRSLEDPIQTPPSRRRLVPPAAEAEVSFDLPTYQSDLQQPQTEAEVSFGLPTYQSDLRQPQTEDSKSSNEDFKNKIGIGLPDGLPSSPDPTGFYWDVLREGNICLLRSILSSLSMYVETEWHGHTGLHIACRLNNVDAVTALLEFGADLHKLDPDGKLPIQLSTSIDVWKAISRKLQSPATTDLSEAVAKGEDVTVRVLLTKEQNPSSAVNKWRGEEKVALLHIAATAEVAQVLIDCGADVDVENSFLETPLHVVSTSGKVDIARVLLRGGADVDCVNEEGWTPLHSAANSGHIEVVKLLIDNHAEICAMDTDGFTPLHMAAWGGHEDVATLLKENGAAVDDKDIKRRTPLFWAAWKGKKDMVRRLIQWGSDVNCKDRWHNTPLHKAASTPYLNTVKVLVENGADLNIRNRYRKIPRDEACGEFGEAVAEFLERCSNR
ncbi:hypothetical protein HDU96_009992 [Phlyctochytrium bullatum]|nr:hypothetical protein HDU96_009992 [Phlyctochytrium bullatum]